MLPEWSRFITEVKLNRGLKESNFDQLYAYLKQHKVHANEERTVIEKGSFNQLRSLGIYLSNSLALLTQSYKSHLPQTNNQLRTSSNARNKATVQDGRVVVQDVRGRYNANNQGRPFQRNNARGNVVARNVGGQNRGGIINPVLDEEQSLFLAGEQVTNFDDDVDNSPENDLALNVDHVFEADECDAFDSNVDEGPTTQTMFMANLTSKDPIYDEVRPSYDSNTPFKYVEDNEEHVVQSNVSSVRDDALMSILDEMHEQGVQSRLANKPDMVVKDSVTSELARYKELVGSIEKRENCRETFNAKDVNPPFIEQMNAVSYMKFESLMRSVEMPMVLFHSDLVNKQSIAPGSDKPGTSSSNTQKHEVHQKVQQTNIPVIPSTGVNTSTEASGSKPRSNTKKNRILPAKSENKKKVEDHPRTNNSVNATPTVKIVLNKGKQIWKPKGKLSDNSLNKTKRVWKATGKLFEDIGYQWRPTGKKFTLGKLNCGYQWRPTGKKFALGEMCPLTKLSVKCCSKHMTGNRSKLKNFVEKFIGTVRFGNDHFGAIMGYGDYVIGDSVISRVYYVEGLGHNLFSVGQFCDSDLEVAFRKHSCFVRDINGADILKGSRSTNLYTISIDDMMKSSPICLLSKASKSKSWLWHRRLNHLNFGTINDLARKDLVRGLPRLKFEKDHLCSACQLGKSKKFSHKPKSENTNMEVLHTLHMDLCGPMRVQSIKGKKYILVIVDDYSRFTWVTFFRSKDETPEFVINFLKQIQVGLNKTVRYIRTDNGTEFVNQVMSEYYESVGVFHQKSVLRTPQQNGIVKSEINDPTISYYVTTKTPYELVLIRRLILPFSPSIGALCYPTTDSEDLGSFQAKADIEDFRCASSSKSGMHHPVRHQGIAEESTLEDSPITHDVYIHSFNPVNWENPDFGTRHHLGMLSSAEPNPSHQPPDHSEDDQRSSSC
ncbi:retrovirus-related pol polyprotein from transposon TNT 1-94 [Tanacetum coccineum]